MIPQGHTGGLFQTNSWLINTHEGAILFDAAHGSFAWTQSLGVTVKHLVLTHQHFDHIEEAAKFARAGAEIYAYQAPSENLTLMKRLLEMGMPISLEAFEVTHLLENQTTLELCGESFQLLHVPGHSPDSLAFYSKDHDFAIVGDTLMAGSIGRSDFPNGDHDTLIRSITSQLLTLPPHTKILSGHGPITNVEREQKTNPFLYA